MRHLRDRHRPFIPAAILPEGRGIVRTSSIQSGSGVSRLRVNAAPPGPGRQGGTLPGFVKRLGPDSGSRFLPVPDGSIGTDAMERTCAKVSCERWFYRPEIPIDWKCAVPLVVHLQELLQTTNQYARSVVRRLGRSRQNSLGAVVHQLSWRTVGLAFSLGGA